MIETLEVNDITYAIVRLLGKGKGGYSYLAKHNGQFFVLKQIHHEPCDYYQFGDKMQSELGDYQKLIKVGIAIPQLIASDLTRERLLKEYIEGPTVAELIEQKALKSSHIEAILDIQEKCKRHGINIDYYPTNFIATRDQLFYVDYECNDYDPKWDFDHWGSQYWK